MSMGVIQIVPKLPPATCGVGDYALAVARVLRNEFGIETRFLVAGSRGESVPRVEPSGAQKLESCAQESLAEALCAATQALENSSVLLHLSPYGYSGRGCPLWLLQGLQRWKRQQKMGRLVTMFHELYATEPPWRKAFWFGPAQRMVVRGIARESETAVTNVSLACNRLERMDPSKRGAIEVLPMPSTVGEPAAPAVLSEREPAMVVFGLPASRNRVYASRATELETACKQLGIAEVHDIGPEFDGIPERIGGIPVHKHGRLEAGDVSTVLSRSTAGFVDYTPGLMGKSSVFAAYCAHRMIPVVPEHSAAESDGIRCGVHYYNRRNAAAQRAVSYAPQQIADAAFEWYRAHSLRVHARLFAGLCACEVLCHE